MEDAAQNRYSIEIAKAVTVRIDAVVAGMADLIVKEIEFYRISGARSEDLHNSLRHNVGYVLARLAGAEAVDLSAPLRRVGSVPNRVCRCLRS